MLGLAHAALLWRKLEAKSDSIARGEVNLGCQKIPQVLLDYKCTPRIK